MADDIVAPTPVTPTPVIQTTPVSTDQAPPVATAPEINPAPVAPVEAVQPAPAPEAPTPEAPKEPVSTVLGEALKEVSPETPKTEEVKVEAQEVKDEGGQSVEPAPPPKYDPFTLPEGVTLDEKQVGEFTNILAGLELEGKADHAKLQEAGQKMVDLYINETKAAAENLSKHYTEVWEKQKADWREATVKDPEIGGNRLQTSIDAALNFIRTHGGTAEQQAEFRSLMDSSGLGNHPAVVRLFARAGQAMSEGRPLAAPKPVIQSKSRTQTMYGKG